MSNGNSAEASTSPSPAPSSIGNNAPKFGTLVPNRVFVGGISGNTTEQDLLELFTKYGKVKATKVISDRAGVSKGYGFVTFETEEEARKLTQEADNIMLKDRKLNIAPAIKKQVNDLGYIKFLPGSGSLDVDLCAKEPVGYAVGDSGPWQGHPRWRGHWGGTRPIPYSPRLVEGHTPATVLGTNGTVFFGNGTTYAYTNPMQVLPSPTEYHQAIAGVAPPTAPAHPTFPPQVHQSGPPTAVSAATQGGGTHGAGYPAAAQFLYPQTMYFPQQFQQFQAAAALQPQWTTPSQWRWVSPSAYPQPESNVYPGVEGDISNPPRGSRGGHASCLHRTAPLCSSSSSSLSSSSPPPHCCLPHVYPHYHHTHSPPLAGHRSAHSASFPSLASRRHAHNTASSAGHAPSTDTPPQIVNGHAHSTVTPPLIKGHVKSHSAGPTATTVTTTTTTAAVVGVAGPLLDIRPLSVSPVLKEQPDHETATPKTWDLKVRPPRGDSPFGASTPASHRGGGSRSSGDSSSSSSGESTSIRVCCRAPGPHMGRTLSSRSGDSFTPSPDTLTGEVLHSTSPSPPLSLPTNKERSSTHGGYPLPAWSPAVHYSHSTPLGHPTLAGSRTRGGPANTPHGSTPQGKVAGHSWVTGESSQMFSCPKESLIGKPFLKKEGPHPNGPMYGVMPQAPVVMVPLYSYGPPAPVSSLWGGPCVPSPFNCFVVPPPAGFPRPSHCAFHPPSSAASTPLPPTPSPTQSSPSSPDPERFEVRPHPRVGSVSPPPLHRAQGDYWWMGGFPQSGGVTRRASLPLVGEQPPIRCLQRLARLPDDKCALLPIPISPPLTPHHPHNDGPTLPITLC